MWWLLIPVIGAVVAAVANSDSAEKEEAARRARAKAREQAEALARKKAAEERQAQRRQQLANDTDRQLDELMALHADIVQRPADAMLGVNLEALQAFAASTPHRTAQGQLKALRLLYPKVRFSSPWLDREVQAKALRKDIRTLRQLQQELLERTP